MTLNGIDFSATAGYAFGEPTSITGDENINVTDTNGESWTANGDNQWTYDKDFVCSSDLSRRGWRHSGLWFRPISECRESLRPIPPRLWNSSRERWRRVMKD